MSYFKHQCLECSLRGRRDRRGAVAEEAKASAVPKAEFKALHVKLLVVVSPTELVTCSSTCQRPGSLILPPGGANGWQRSEQYPKQSRVLSEASGVRLIPRQSQNSLWTYLKTPIIIHMSGMLKWYSGFVLHIENRICNRFQIKFRRWMFAEQTGVNVWQILIHLASPVPGPEHELAPKLYKPYISAIWRPDRPDSCNLDPSLWFIIPEKKTYLGPKRHLFVIWTFSCHGHPSSLSPIVSPPSIV